MTDPNRRSFLKHTATASVVGAAWAWNGEVNAAEANDRLAIFSGCEVPCPK